MVSVEEAKKLVLEHTGSLDSIEKDLNESLNFVLADDIIAPISLPPFDQSAMDGYALGPSNDLKKNSKFRLNGEIQAGDTQHSTVNPREAIRIFTGAPIPKDTAAVVMQEWTELNDKNVILTHDVKENSNIRKKGEEIKKGEIALRAGSKLNPAAIGFLNGLGITTVNVYRKAKIIIASTGNEIIKPGQDLAFGQIFESNSAALSNALINCGFADTVTVKLKDDLDETIETLRTSLLNCDVLIISGGISVGDHDYVGKAIEAIEAKQIFYKVKQKPGKPMLFAKKEEKTIFALPGNPAAALTCLYEYVIPSLRKQNYETEVFLRNFKLPIIDRYIKRGDRAQFLKGQITDEGVRLLDGQSSSMMFSYAIANCLVYIPAEKAAIDKNELVEVHLLP